MSQDESCQDRQKNELEVLKSIFGDELRDLRKNKQKKKWQPLQVSITLTPQKGMSGPAEIYTKIDLVVVCGDKYPEEVPSIELQNSKGLSDQQVALHTSELEELAKQRVGEVMIYDLCQHVQKFLHEHNNKPRYGSFYDEMVWKQEERKKCELQEKQIKEDKERQVLQDEINKRQEAFKEMQMSRRESTRLSLESDLIISKSIPSSPHERLRTLSRRRCMSTSESSEGSLCEHRGTKMLHFDNNKRERQVHRGKCLDHSKKGSVVYAGVDAINGELLAITEWTLKCVTSCYDNNDTTNLQNLMKQIAGIEQELNHLYKLQNINLVHYLNMKYSQERDNIIVYILQEFVQGTSCSYYLKENIPVDKDMLKHLAVGILSALQYLHDNNVVHKDLRDTNVYIDRTGLIKIANYSLDKRLSDIYQACCLARVEHDFPAAQGRSGKKGDIFKFGILLLSLTKGSIITEEDLTNNSLSYSDLQPDLKDFISKCLDSDDRSRWSAEQLLQHCFIQTPLERGLPPPRLNGNKEQNCAEPEEEPDDGDIPFDLSAFGGQSRLKNEFEVLKWLGNGAFGDVLKVRNKLDGGLYALKRIKLNPTKKLLNKKMTREVKLLSRLNHENVVRYYNSWIESATLDDTTYNAFLPSTTPSTRLTSKDKICSIDDDFGSGSIERLAPPMHEVKWNISYKSRASEVADSEEDNSDQDSDSDGDWGFMSKTRADSSDSIEFERDDKSKTTNSRSVDTPDGGRRSENAAESNDKSKKELQFMYLQMEFCEKSTLRTAIDNGLYKDEERVWRLFREIVEGLSHIHQKGMIHRDLKPVNIFLDSNDHVKIGDFGLATTNILSQTIDIKKESQVTDKGFNSEKDYSESLTGQVGTALYVAPELSGKAVKAIYNQKVDIYSLGIIFFEMCYKPLKTGMERVKIILNIRSKNIILPPELEEKTMTNKVHLLRWLLNHDPSQRPAANDLLASEYLPPPQLEEAELQEMVRHTLSDAQSRAYKYLVSCCFSQQETTPADDITYDMQFSIQKKNNSLLLKTRLTQEYVKSKVVEIFQKHGAMNISTPLLMPKSGLYNVPESCVQMMTRTGSIISIPHDLRAPFARYVAWNNITNIRRYAIERVYRENKNYNQAHIGFHPRELYECAFDIITPVENNLTAEAELISIISEVCNEIPELQDRTFTIRINHTSLLQAVLMSCGIEREKFQDIYTILRDARKLKRFQMHTHLVSLCLTDQAMNTLFKLFDTESSITALAEELKIITKRKGEAAALAKQGLKEVEIVVSILTDLGVKWPIMVAPLFVHNIQQYSGIFYQITYESNRKRKRVSQDVVAAGGRYDKMLASFRQLLQRTGMENKEQYGVGISISLDKLVSALGELAEEFFRENKLTIDVAVCCVGEGSRQKELAEVLRELWSLDLKVTCIDLRTVEEIMEHCRENNINHVVMIKSGEKGSLRIQSWERDRFQERKISIQDVAEYFQKQTENTVSVALNRSDSKISANQDVNISSNTPNSINITFILTDKDRLSGSSKRNYKNSILAQLSSFSQRISHKVPIEVFAVFLDMTVVRTINTFLEIDENDQDFQKSIQVIIEKHPRHKKHIKDICESMWEVRSSKSRPVLILYSLIDSRHMTMM